MWVKFLPYLAAASLGLWGWGEHQRAERYKADVVREIEACNSSKLSEELEAEILVAAAQKDAHERQIQNMLEIVDRQRRAKEIALEAAELAESRPAKIRTIIERIADEEACISTVVPSELVDSLFND